MKMVISLLKKFGTRNGIESVDWEILINKSQSTISSVTLTDTLSSGLELDEDSFVLLDKDGNTLVFDDYFTLKKT